MDKILLFAGTTEGRNLAEFLEKNQIPTEVCVATQYGETLLEEGKYLHVHVGRLDEKEMEQQIQKQQITLVIDATHPYAVIVSQNIRRRSPRQDECGHPAQPGRPASEHPGAVQHRR